MTIHHLKAGDTSPGIRRTLTEGSGTDGTPIDLSGCLVHFQVRRRENLFGGSQFAAQDGELMLDETATIIQTTTADGIENMGVVQYRWRDGETDTPGTYVGEFVVTYADGSIETFPNTGHIHIHIHPDV